jgi:hypothetical protein
MPDERRLSARAASAGNQYHEAACFFWKCAVRGGKTLNLFENLKHAFAVAAPPAPPSPAESALVDRLAAEVVRRGLTTPALMFLEMSRPMNFIGAQGMHFLAPLVTSICQGEDYQTLAHFLERRDAIEMISSRIEALQARSLRKESSPPRSSASS